MVVDFSHILFDVIGLEPEEDEKIPPFIVEYFKDDFRKYRKALESISRNHLIDVNQHGVISLGFTKGRNQSILVKVDNKTIKIINKTILFILQPLIFLILILFFLQKSKDLHFHLLI